VTKRLSIGTGISAFLVVVGVAVSLSDKLRNETLALLLIVEASVYLAVCVVVAAWRKIAPGIASRRQAAIDQAVERALREHLVREVRPWVKADVQREIAEHMEGSQKLAAIAATLHDAAAAAEDTQPVAEAALRLALNELSEELEYILDRIAEDEPGYWRRLKLPNVKWVEHGALLASTDNRGHEALRAAYREADRINHCLHNQRQRFDDHGKQGGREREALRAGAVRGGLPQRHRPDQADAGGASNGSLTGCRGSYGVNPRGALRRALREGQPSRYRPSRRRHLAP
jgi:hypothetical protein